MLDTPPKTSLFGHLRVKADQLTWGEGYGRVIDSSEGQGHMPYMEIHVLLKVRVDHLTTLAQSFVSFWSQLYMQQHLICDSLIQTYYISKLNKKCNEKNAGNQEETVSSVGTGKEILLIC